MAVFRLDSLGNVDSQSRLGQAVPSQVREKEHADYQVTHADYSESVDSLTRATQVPSARRNSGVGRWIRSSLGMQRLREPVFDEAKLALCESIQYSI